MSESPSAPQLSVIWWGEIPAQVVAQSGGETIKAELPGRFQAAIDGAAMAAGQTDAEAYLEQWDRRARPCSSDLQAEVDAEVASLENRFSPDVLAGIVRAAHSGAADSDTDQPG